MKAFILEGNGIETLRLAELPVPEPGKGEVLIKTKAITLNPVDIAMMTVEPVRKGLYNAGSGEPVIPAWDIAGEVTAVGQDVSEIKVGDKVFGCIKFPGQGKACAEYVAAPAEQLALIPDGITFEEAAAATMAAITPYEALVVKGKITKNDKVLIHAAAGGVGHFAVQIAKSFGAYVIGTASTANVDFVKSIGADEVIDYKKVKFEEVVTDADLVLDSIDAVNLLRSLDAVKPGGRVVSLKATFDGEIAQKAEKKNVTGIREGIGSSGELTRKVAGLLASGQIKPAIFKTFTFDEFPAAAAAMGQIRYGKIVIKF
jgi:NADPH:quinone reductase-like Zn-dependent oxidoreductase